MSRKVTHHNRPSFAGFHSPRYTQVPDEIFDHLMPILADAELRVLLYIVRRTFGFKRDTDNISLSQMVDGIVTRDGTRLDAGAGVSKASAVRAVKGLLELGVITKQTNRSAERGNEATTYALRFSHTPLSHHETRGLVSSRDKPLSHHETHNKQEIQETDFDLSKFERSHDEKLIEPDQTRPHISHEDHTTSEQGKPGRASAAVLPAAASTESTSDSIALSAESPHSTDFVTPYDPPKRPVPSRGGGFADLREQVKQRRAQLPPPPDRPGRPPGHRDERDLVRAYLTDFRPFLGDEAPLASSITRAINIFKAGQIPQARWTDLLYEANAITKEQTQNITKKPGASSNGFAAKNRAPYYFAVLEDLCGLRERADPMLPGTP